MSLLDFKTYYRQTLETWWFWFQTIIKQVVKFLLAEGLAFRL